MRCSRKLPLKQGWQFSRGDQTSSFLDCQDFPTEIHRDLLHHGLIPDPFQGKNENLVQWVGEVDWLYRTSFETPNLNKKEKAFLIFEGLDTFAIVHLNGERILQTSNMFVPERIDVTTLLCQNHLNSLEVLFESAWLKGKRYLEDHPEHTWVCSNGDASRLAVRKAQYHYVNMNL